MSEPVGGDSRSPTPKLERWEKKTEWPLATVALIFLAAYSIRVLVQPQGHLDDVLQIFIWITWGAFLADYVARLCLATDRRQWFVRHLVDLTVVALPVLRPLRLLRLVVLVVALQKAVGGAIRGRVAVYTACSVLLLIYVASLAILDAERFEPDSKIRSFGAAVWWSITTVTTVNYSDPAPVSGTGKVIAVALVIGGISLIGIVTATLASWIVQRVAEEDAAHQAVTATEIDTLRVALESQIAALRVDIRHLGGSDDPLVRTESHQ